MNIIARLPRVERVLLHRPSSPFKIWTTENLQNRSNTVRHAFTATWNAQDMDPRSSAPSIRKIFLVDNPRCNYLGREDGCDLVRFIGVVNAALTVCPLGQKRMPEIEVEVQRSNQIRFRGGMWLETLINMDRELVGGKDGKDLEWTRRRGIA